VTPQLPVRGPLALSLKAVTQGVPTSWRGTESPSDSTIPRSIRPPKPPYTDSDQW